MVLWVGDSVDLVSWPPPKSLVSPLLVCCAILSCSILCAGPDGKTSVPSKYDLIANVVHEGKAGQQTGTAPYRAHIHRGVEKAWYEVHVSHTAAYSSLLFCCCVAGRFDMDFVSDTQQWVVAIASKDRDVMCRPRCSICPC